VRDAFLEQMQVHLKWTRAASLTPDVQQAIAAGLSYFAVDDGLGKKIQAQSQHLSQCRAELAALKKSMKKWSAPATSRRRSPCELTSCSAGPSMPMGRSLLL
jgi:hypothetical protein